MVLRWKIVLNTININHSYEIPTLATLEPCHATRMWVHLDTKDRGSFVKSSDFFSLFPLFSLVFLFKNAIPSIGAKCLYIWGEKDWYRRKWWLKRGNYCTCPESSERSAIRTTLHPLSLTRFSSVSVSKLLSYNFCLCLVTVSTFSGSVKFSQLLRRDY